jgi:hypothetical protein
MPHNRIASAPTVLPQQVSCMRAWLNSPRNMRARTGLALAEDSICASALSEHEYWILSAITLKRFTSCQQSLD